MIISRAPLRITLAGGGTDLPSFSDNFGGKVLSAAINKYVYVSVIRPFDKSIIGDIEKAIVEANLGLNPMNNGDLIIINVPALTEERRKELVKQVKLETENCKVSIRNARQRSNEEVKKLAKDGLSEDMARDAESSVQNLTDRFIVIIEKHFTDKEKDVMTI